MTKRKKSGRSSRQAKARRRHLNRAQAADALHYALPAPSGPEDPQARTEHTRLVGELRTGITAHDSGGAAHTLTFTQVHARLRAVDSAHEADAQIPSVRAAQEHARPVARALSCP